MAEAGCEFAVRVLHRKSITEYVQTNGTGLFSVTAVHDKKVVGMGRLIGDGAMYWYLQEIVVSPKYQGLGIGTRIVNRLIDHVKESALPGSKVTVGLMAAKGKERFYEKLGFYGRPNDNCGSGMEMRLNINNCTCYCHSEKN